MKQTIEEQLSALLDGELPVEEEELLLRRMKNEPRHRETLARFGLIGEAMRGEVIVPSLLALSDSVRSVLDAEDTHRHNPSRTAGGKLRTAFAGAAVAATIAIVALVSIGRQGEVPVTAPGSEFAAGAVAADAAISYTVPASVSRQAVIAPARLTGYLVSHGEYTSGLSRQVMNSYVVRQAPQTAQPEATGNASND